MTDKYFGGRIHVSFLLKDVLGCAERHENCLYGRIWKYFLERSADRIIFQRESGDDAEVTIKDLKWYEPHFTPSIPEDAILSRHRFAEASEELS